MRKPTLVFMGTPQFAVPTFLSLLDSGYPIALVVTQPDKPVGRKQVLTPPPIKLEAEARGISVIQPAKIKKSQEVHERLQAVGADLFVVIAYGKILPQSILDIPRYGCINVHASLLPAYRGAAPIQWSIVKGETETGITTMCMDAGMDTGDILLQDKIPIDFTDNGTTLSEKLSKLGAHTLLKTIPDWVEGRLKAAPQDSSEVTYAPMLSKQEGLINWKQSATEIYNQMRGLQPWPETYTYFNDKALKIKASFPVSDTSERGVSGQVLDIDRQGFTVRTGAGALQVKRVHLAGSKEMMATDFARGQRLEPGYIFLSELSC